MAEILHDFPIKAPPARVFAAFATPAGLDTWWTLRAAGTPEVGAEYELYFGAEYDWRGKVTRSVPGVEFELQLTRAMDDWLGSLVGVRLEGTPTGTQVRFHHTGWSAPTEHFRISTYCWAMYLRILKRNLEHGETVPYEMRLDV